MVKKLLATLTTDSQGRATYTYTGTGAGDVKFSAESTNNGRILSKTYEVYDCLYYLNEHSSVSASQESSFEIVENTLNVNLKGDHPSVRVMPYIIPVSYEKVVLEFEYNFEENCLIYHAQSGQITNMGYSLNVSDSFQYVKIIGDVPNNKVSIYDKQGNMIREVLNTGTFNNTNWGYVIYKWGNNVDMNISIKNFKIYLI